MDLVLVNTSNDISDITSDNLHLISLRLNILGKMVSALYPFLLVIGLNIHTAALSMISGSGKNDS